MLRYNSPFGISTQMSKTMVRLPFRAPDKSLDIWVPPLKKKNTQNSALGQSSKILESKLSITNLTVDSSSFGPSEYKPEKKEKADLSRKLKVAWHIKKRQSLLRREDNKRKANLNRCFSLKSKQATIHSIHPPEEMRYSVNSWNQAFIDRAIQNLTVELKQLFNLRPCKKVEKVKLQKKAEGEDLCQTAYIQAKHIDTLRRTTYKKDELTPNRRKETRKNQSKKDEGWLPWNEHSLRKNVKQKESEVVAEWYDRNFSISLG